MKTHEPTIDKRPRITSIDALRGLAMFLMLVGHARVNFFVPIDVADPMNIEEVPTALFLTRLTGHICTFVFIFLAGVSVSLMATRQKLTESEISLFLLKRGLILILFEFTLVSFGWSLNFPPRGLHLQVIWATGLCMLFLSALIWLPRFAILAVGAIIAVGHNLLDGFSISENSPFFLFWAILHEQAFIDFGESFYMRIAYPVLPWIGVMAIGYWSGQFFERVPAAQQRSRIFFGSGVMLLAAFALIRLMNGYGDQPYLVTSDIGATIRSFVNVTKYPPSLLYLLLTAGCTCLLFSLFERTSQSALLKPLRAIGSAPMFFYLTHLYLIQVVHFLFRASGMSSAEQAFHIHQMLGIWLLALALALCLYWPTQWFSNLKKRRKDWAWLQYF
ncbi:DUF1624 domain-containing protein [Pseudomonas lopnurensis]|uniref:DUF1624 domain-containing protein n=1 Tax=Pseudomonas lopnurensis TaxID=1477517 RepID=UPI00187A3886|nr:heparan-alpha-glucosaminide N-acetyltransferase domain-containing protein [Pseudomonas lopnurensis]MBE7376788.1 DUF1624 domain-containing protein [Pseudomonas lopnurensis]